VEYCIREKTITEKTTVMAEFSISGDNFKVTDVTRALKLEPTRYWDNGDITGIIKSPKRHTCWIINTGYDESLDIDKQLLKLFNILKDKTAILKHIKSEFHLELTVCIVIKVEKGEVPAMHIDSYIINFTHEIEASIEFDFYYFS
jgi:hypothetical protein